MNRGELKTRFKSIIDDVSDNVFTDTRIEDLLYEGAQAVQNELELRDNTLFMTTHVIALEATDVTTSLPEDCGNVLALKRTDLTPPKTFTRVNFTDLETWSAEKYVYAIAGNSIYYSRRMDESHSLTVYYSQLLADLESDEESWSLIPPKAHSLIAYEAALLAIASEESAMEALLSLYVKRRENVLASFSPRDTSQPRIVRLVC